MKICSAAEQVAIVQKMSRPMSYNGGIRGLKSRFEVFSGFRQQVHSQNRLTPNPSPVP